MSKLGLHQPDHQRVHHRSAPFWNPHHQELVIENTSHERQRNLPLISFSFDDWQWWPRPESNGHVPFGTTDFKSGASNSSATGPQLLVEGLLKHLSRSRGWRGV